MPEVLKKVWAKEVIKALTAKDDDSFLNGVKDQTALVTQGEDGDTIYLHRLLTKPATTINGTLPVGVMRQQYDNEPIGLDTFRTENTAVSDDDLFASSIDKIKIASESHVLSLAEKRVAYAAYRIAPTTNTANSPVFLTTGAVDAIRNEKMLTKADILRAKRELDNQSVPATDRVLVLSADHLNDLLTTDNLFEKQYYDYRKGELPPMIYGFEVHSYIDNPLYVKSTLTKKSFGASKTTADRQCSFFFYRPNVFKAWGKTKMFYNNMENDVLNEEQLMHIKQRAICRAILQINIGAIIGD